MPGAVLRTVTGSAGVAGTSGVVTDEGAPGEGAGSSTSGVVVFELSDKLSMDLN
jgi:hypothetical protein